ncbi:MAG TPA: family 16 glycoside hydrolase [Terriglobales bacterium]|nr:family 16 glycoside hydrolase [Terriglobales bacterium]
MFAATIQLQRRLLQRAAQGLSLALAGLVVSAISVVNAPAQTRDLTVDVLINSTNTTGYNTSLASPGEYQRYPERYLEYLQIPYRVIDVSNTAPPDLTTVPLVIAGHRGLNLSSAWQQAILSAVEAGVGFVNLDSDPAIGTNAHMQAIFGCTSSAPGTPGTGITIPATYLPDGATPHYITQLQLRWPIGNPNSATGNMVYNFHNNDNGVVGTATSTVLLNAQGQPHPGGTVLATIGSDAFWTVTTFGSGHAVNIGTYDYLKADRFGFVMGLDDIFWRSLVWAAKKPFVFRGYPRLFAIQQDDPADGYSTRVEDMFNPSLTGPGTVQTLPNGTKVTIGGPWRVTGNIQDAGADYNNGSQARQTIIDDINGGYLKIGPHTNTGGSGGDLYWTGENPSPLNDNQWLSNYNALLSFQQGGGSTGSFNGTSDVLPFTSYMIPHFWDFSNNVGYDMWQLGVRYVSEIQQPGVYDSGPCKAPAQRLPGLHPFRVYEQPPSNCNPNEIWPIFWVDNYTIGSRAGLPAKTFFGFTTQLQGMNYPSFDAKWPNSAGGISPATALENWEAYTWRFWSSMGPVEIYNHDGGSMADSTTQERQQHIINVSSWVTGHGGRPVFMEDMGAYLHARVNSNITGGSVNASTITLNFSGSATDMNGNPVTTESAVFFNDDDGTQIDVPGFANGTSISFPNVTPPGLALNKNSLSFLAVPGGSNPPAQNVSITNSGAGTLSWTASSNATWLTVSPGSGTNSGTLTASANISGLAQGTYTASILVTASGATDSPQSVAVTLVISNPKLGINPASITFDGIQGQPNPAAVPVDITNLGGGVINWTASLNPSSSWLSLSSTSGTAPSTSNAQANISGLAIGNYSGSIQVSSPGVSNSPQTVPVTLNISGLLMSSDFNDGTMNGWAISPLGRAQNWLVVNGVLQYNGGGHTQIYAGDAAWSNYDLQVDIKLASLSDYPGGIRGRVNPGTGASYALWLYPNEKTVKLYRTVAWNIDSGFTLLAQASFTFDTSSFHTYRLSFHGSTIQALVDGASLISVTDTTLAGGMVALDVSSQVINFDNVFVTGSTATNDAISAVPNSFSFTAQAGGSNPPAQAMQLSSSGGILAWSVSTNVSWLTLSAGSGQTGSSLNVSANTAGLGAGNYNGTILVFSKGAQNSPIPISVALTVSPQPVILVSTPASLNFFGATSLNPAGQTITITNGGAGIMNWNGSGDSSWITVNPPGGTAPSTATVNINSTSLTIGQYSGNAVLSSPQAGNSPLSVPVSLHVGNLLFSDDFSSGNAGNWQISPLGHAQDWSVVNSAYAYDGAGPTQAYTGSMAWMDYSFSADFKLSGTSNYPGGIRARLNTTTGGGYGVWFYPGSGLIRLYSIGQWNIDSGFALLAQAPLAFDTNMHNIRIDLHGTTIQVFYDNAQVLQVTDATFAAGGVALDVSNQPIQYTNVKVISF